MYRCPECLVAGRDKDSVKKEGSLVIRTIIYECGTLLRIIQDGMRFRSNLTVSEKCCENPIKHSTKGHA